MKLIRDRIADKRREQGENVLEVTGKKQQLQLLMHKLMEEAAELFMEMKLESKEKGDRANTIDEMVDVLDVIDQLQQLLEIRNYEINEAMVTKRTIKGDFSGYNVILSEATK